MSISEKTKKQIWAKSGNRCAFPGCNQLVCDKKLDNTILGEICHIEAQSEGGPRFNPKLSKKEIDSEVNLIILCPTHHKVIDENPDKYTVEVLRRMKDTHENKICQYQSDISNTSNQNINLSITIVNDGNVGEHNKGSSDNLALQILITDKIETIRASLFELRMSAVSESVKKIHSDSIESTEDKNYYYLFRVICALYNGVASLSYIEEMYGQLKGEAEWLSQFYQSPRELKTEEFKYLCSEVQIVVIDKLFKSGLFASIINLYESCFDHIDKRIGKQFRYHYGLSLLNLGSYNKSHIVFSSLYDEFKDGKYKLFDICANIGIQNTILVAGELGPYEVLPRLLKDLKKEKEKNREFSSKNELFFVNMEMHSLYNLGLRDSEQLNQIVDYYHQCSNEIKSEQRIKMYLALAYDNLGKQEEAVSVYSQIDWIADEEICIRYMLCLIGIGKCEEAVAVYQKLPEQMYSPRTKGVYLFAISFLDQNHYSEELRNAVKKYKDSLTDLYSLVCYVRDPQLFHSIFLPLLRRIIEKDSLAFNSITEYEKRGFALVFANNGEIELLYSTIESISELKTLSSYSIDIIEQHLLSFVNQEYEEWRINKTISSIAHIAERIADKFLASGIIDERLLRIKMLSCGAQGMTVSMINTAKQLFSVSPDAFLAHNIIVGLLEHKKKRISDYKPYLDFLSESHVPIHSVVIASVMKRLGKKEDFDFYLYKALFDLNGKHDFEVYEGVLGLILSDLKRGSIPSPHDDVMDNDVVELQMSEGTIRRIILDSESEFSVEGNHSLGLEHINRENPWYSVIKNLSVGNEVILDGQEWMVKSVVHRSIVIRKFLFEMVSKKPEGFGGIELISANSTEELIEKLKKRINKSQATEELLRLYNSADIGTGLPIDAFVTHDYGRYIDAVRYLLFQKDLAFFAGESNPENLNAETIVPTISSLVVLAINGWLNLLNPLRTSIVISESLRDFIRDNLMKEVDYQVVSPGFIIGKKGGDISFVERGKYDVEIWQLLWDWCKDLGSIKVSDDERQASIMGDDISWERCFSGLNLSVIQMDAFIIAKKYSAVYMSDDLFFRRIARFVNVPTINVASILMNINIDDAMPMILELAKTNYIYTPVVFRNPKEGELLISNLLEGEKKKQYYSAFFRDIVRISLKNKAEDCNSSKKDIEYEERLD